MSQVSPNVGRKPSWRKPQAASRKPVLLPLLAALGLAGLFVFLLVRQAGKLAPPVKESAPVSTDSAERPVPAGLKVPPEEIPLGSPTDPGATPRRPRFNEGTFFRWNIQEFPPRWDPVIAKAVHDYFELMEVNFYDPEDSEKLANLEKVREELRQYLASLGPEAVPTLATILNHEVDFVNRRFLLYGLGDLGPKSEEATFALEDYFLARQADPANRSEVHHVIQAMGRLNNDSSFEVLQDLVRRDELQPHRYRLLEVLGDHRRRDEAVGVFLDHMLDSRSFDVRNRAAQALGKVAAPETLSDLYHAFDRERVWYAKQTILGTIGKIGDPASIPFLAEKARHAPESGVRLSAAGALRRIGTPPALQVLEDLARTETDPGVRRHIERWARAE